MNNKPFWQDKTCKEMAGLHVKVTFKNGDEITGMTNVNGDLKIPDTSPYHLIMVTPILSQGMKLSPSNYWIPQSMSVSKI